MYLVNIDNVMLLLTGKSSREILVTVGLSIGDAIWYVRNRF
jgi:hypothetical protein